MTLSTATIQTIEMTQEEENTLWDTFYTEPRPLVCGKVPLQWDTNDGRNLMLLEGEKSFRTIVITPTP